MPSERRGRRPRCPAVPAHAAGAPPSRGGAAARAAPAGGAGPFPQWRRRQRRRQQRGGGSATSRLGPARGSQAALPPSPAPAPGAQGRASAAQPRSSRRPQQRRLHPRAGRPAALRRPARVKASAARSCEAVEGEGAARRPGGGTVVRWGAERLPLPGRGPGGGAGEAPALRNGRKEEARLPPARPAGRGGRHERGETRSAVSAAPRGPWWCPPPAPRHCPRGWWGWLSLGCRTWLAASGPVPQPARGGATRQGAVGRCGPPRGGQGESAGARTLRDGQVGLATRRTAVTPTGPPGRLGGSSAEGASEKLWGDSLTTGWPDLDDRHLLMLCYISGHRASWCGACWQSQAHST